MQQLNQDKYQQRVTDLPVACGRVQGADSLLGVQSHMARVWISGWFKCKDSHSNNANAFSK